MKAIMIIAIVSSAPVSFLGESPRVVVERIEFSFMEKCISEKRRLNPWWSGPERIICVEVK